MGKSEPSNRADLPSLSGTRVTLRPAGPEDAERLAQIVAEPSVASWWVGYDVDKIRQELVAGDIRTFVIQLAGETIGAIQFHEQEEPAYRHAAVDLFLTTSKQAQGLGREALVAVARYLFDGRGHHRITIDPATSNEHAIKAYRAVGFHSVGVMHHYERSPNGKWRDGLLMELLAKDLPRVRTPGKGRAGRS